MPDPALSLVLRCGRLNGRSGGIPRPGDSRAVCRADTEGIDSQVNIRSFLPAALVCLAVLVFATSASAKGGPPAGKGGPPPWAGGGKSAKVHGAKGAAKKAEHAARKAEKAAKKADKAREGEELNPAMTCFGLLAEMGEEFYAHFGTNPNQANAFGKCVSEQAQAKGEGGEGEAEEPADCEAPAEEAPAATTLDELQEPTEGEEPMDDCAPAEDEPGECDEQADAPPVEDGSAELAASEDPDTDGECSSDDEESGEPDEGEPEDTDGATSFALTCFLPRAHANPFVLCL